MEESSYDKHGQNAKVKNQDSLSKIYQEDVSSTNKYSKHKEPSRDENDFQIRNKSVVDDLSRQSLCRKSYETIKNYERTENENRAVAVAANVSADAECDDDDKEVLLKELRNGCEKNIFYQKLDSFSLPYQLKNISLKQISSNNSLRTNVPEKSSTCTNTSNPSAVIPLAGQNTTKARDPNESKFEEDITEQSFNDNITKNKTAIIPYVSNALRGKNVAQSTIYNLSTEAVNVSNSYSNTAAISNQMQLKYAYQSPYACITVPSLHACYTFNHFHYNHHNHHHHHHNHNNQTASKNYANELSSRLLFKITYDSSYCTNLASKSQAKRQFSFLKSQSLEIVKDSSYLIYHERDDDDEHLFFQMSEIVEDDTQKNSLRAKEQRHNMSQLSNLENVPCSQTGIANTGEVIANEGSTITRSLSLSSHKTGVDLKTQSLESRPIYPNVPYSPYASPYSSPRSNRRKTPLRESRRVSIEQSGSFLQLNQYKLMDQIGQGSYGLVKLAYSEEDSIHYAMKILSKRRLVRQAGLIRRGQKKFTSPLDRVYREIAVLKKLDHPNVVKLVEVLDDPVEDSLYMVFELVKQGEVLSIPTKNPLSEERAWSVFRDTVLGLEYLHYQRIVHGDIKPGNLLLTECGRVKIADLGVCNEFIGEDAIMTNVSTAGTPAFRAPESLNVGQNIYCGKAADIWALGSTLYALLYGNVPFVASSIPALYEKIKTEELSFPEIPKTSVEVRDFIQSILTKDPGLRITLPQIKEHVWVNAGGLHPLPSEEENCRLVQVDDDDINSVVRSIPKLDTLILIKTMLKKHSFGNPFSRGISGRAAQVGGSRLERFIRAGRSNSAPGFYNMIAERQLSGDNVLPALCEHSPPSSCTNEDIYKNKYVV